MKKIVLVLAVVSSWLFSIAQEKKVIYSGAIGISHPIYFSTDITASNAMGLGVEFQREKIISKQFSWTLSAGYQYPSGNYTFYDFSTSSISTVHQFAFVPVLTGLQFNYNTHLYLSATMGVSISASKYAGTSFAFVPGLGYVTGVGKKHRIDIGLRLINVIEMPSIPEANSITRGGYGILSLRAAYQF